MRWSETDLDPCDNTTYSRSYYVSDVAYCVLFNVSLSFNTSRYVIPKITSPPPVVTLRNVRIEVANRSASDTSYPLNYLFVTMDSTASVTLVNTSLHAPYVWLFANGNVTVDRLSRISADGFAPSGLAGNPLTSNFTSGSQGGGGGSGGVGGRGCQRDYPNARGGGACGDPVTPPGYSSPQFGGPGSLGVSNRTRRLEVAEEEDGFGLGGGFVWVQLTGGELRLDGQITANGVDGWHPTVAAGGGAGGFIYIDLQESAELTFTAQSGGSLIAANGGGGVNGGGGGAGGRIYISGPHADVYTTAFGGGVGVSAQQCATQGGGQGTIFLSNGTADSYELRCIGPSSIPTDLTLIGTTDFSNSSTVDRLVLTNCFLLATPLVQLTSSLGVFNSILQPSAPGGGGLGSLTIICPAITTGSNGVIQARSLTLLCITLKVGSQADQLRFEQSASINCSDSITVEGKVLQGGQVGSLAHSAHSLLAPSFPGLLILAAPTVTLTVRSEVSVAVVEVASTSLTASGSVVASYQRKDANCSAAIPTISLNATCAALPFSFDHPSWTPWASVVIQSRQVSFSGTQAVEGGVIVMCAEEIALGANVVISSNSNGCPESQGEGAGSLGGSGEGGGAGHGGEGGAGVSLRAARSLSSQLLLGGAGIEYDNGSLPCMVGSGGSGGSTGGTGGSGGGLIFLEATSLTLGANSRLASDGGGGTGAASGGGSGGSIVLHLGSLHADAAQPAFITAVGGAATDDGNGKYGGSGGGGRIFIEWFAAQPVNQRDMVVFSAQAGNASSNVSIGHAGTVLTNPQCRPGFDGVLCVGCAVGTYKNESGLQDCLPCDGGSYANATNSTACTLCSAGTHSNSNLTGCLDCVGDTMSAPGSTVCIKCAAGTETDSRHTGCTSCEMGTYKGDNDSSCLPCLVGTFSSLNFSTCVPCPSPPLHSHYVSLVGSKCQYDCDVGYLLPDCLTPFWSMVDGIGGVAVFVSFLVVTLTVTFIPFLCCFIRSRRRQREKEILEADQAETDSEAGDSRPPSPPNPSKLSRNFSAAPNYDHSALNTSLMEATTQPSFKDLLSTSLQPRHYPHHLHRIYLSGDNSWNRPLTLSRGVPVEVSALVFDDAYGEFAEQVSALGRWSRMQHWAYCALAMLCPPLAASYMRRTRKKHVAQVWQFIANYDHSMLRNAKSRALASSLLFGASSCHTLAWIDVLANSREEKQELPDGVAGLPRLPLVLLASGDGSYHTPFHFDVSDAYVKSATEYVGMNWHKFVRTLNTHVRPVRRSALFSKKALAPAVALLRVENHMGVGIGKNLPLGGVRVELGWVGEDSHIGGGALPVLILTAKEDSGQAMVVSTSTVMGGKPGERPTNDPQPFSRTEQLLSTRLPIFPRNDRSPQSSDSGRDAQRLSQSYTSSSYLTSDDDEESGPSIMERALGQTGQRKVQQYLSAKQRLEAEQAQWRNQKKLTSSYASLPKSEDSVDTPNAQAFRAFAGRRDAASVVSRVNAPQLSARKKKPAPLPDRRDTAQERKDDDTGAALDASMLIADVSPILIAQLPYAASFYQFDSSRSSSVLPSPKRRSVNSAGHVRARSSLSSSFPLPSDTMPSPRVGFGYRLQGLVLFNVPLYLSRTALACAFLLLLFVRVGVSLIIWSSSFQLALWLFEVSLLLYPLAPLLVPLLGLITLVSSSTHACRFFSCAVVLSLLNDVVVLVGSLYSFNTSLGLVDALLLPPLAIVLTLALLITSHAYVAHLEVLKDLVMGRREDVREKDKEGEEGYGSGGGTVSQSPQSNRKGSRRSSVHGDAHQGERAYKERRGTGRASAPPREESKAEDTSQPPTPSTAASEEPSTPIQQRETFGAFSSTALSAAPPAASALTASTKAVHSAPMAVPVPRDASPSSAYVPTLSPVLPTPPSMGATHSLLSSSLHASSNVDVGSPPPTPAALPSSRVPSASPTAASRVGSAPSASPVPPSPAARTPSVGTGATASTSARPVKPGSGASSGSATPTATRRGRGGVRGGGGRGGGASGAPVTGSARGKTKRGAKTST